MAGIETLRTVPMDSFRGRHSGEAVCVAACGNSLRNWPARYFDTMPTIFVNTAIHAAGDVCPEKFGRYRIVFDLAVIRSYLYCDTFVDPTRAAPKAVPSVHTFISALTLPKCTPEVIEFMAGTTWTPFQYHRKAVPLSEVMATGILWRPTAFAAMSLAVYMGAKKVILAGVDWGYRRQTHYDHTVEHDAVVRGYLESMRQRYVDEIVPRFEQHGVEIVRLAAPEQPIPHGAVLRADVQ